MEYRPPKPKAKKKYYPLRKQMKYPKTFMCPLCLRYFKTRWEREEHMNKHQLKMRFDDE